MAPEEECAHTDRFSNRYIPEVIDLELLYQLILRCWEFHCGEKKRVSRSSLQHQCISYALAQPNPRPPLPPASLYRSPST